MQHGYMNAKLAKKVSFVFMLGLDMFLLTAVWKNFAHH